jgi:hypothetical protein
MCERKTVWWSGPVHGPTRFTVRSTGRHGTGRHGPFSGEGRTDSPLDRTVVGYGPVHDHDPVRNESDRPVHFKSLVTSTPPLNFNIKVEPLRAICIRGRVLR